MGRASSGRTMGGALAASLLVHAAMLALSNAPAAMPAAPPGELDVADRWAGTTAEVPGERLYEVDPGANGAPEPGSAARAPAVAEPEAPAVAEPEPAVTEPEAPAVAPPEAPAVPPKAPAVRPAAPIAPPAPTIAKTPRAEPPVHAKRETAPLAPTDPAEQEIAHEAEDSDPPPSEPAPASHAKRGARGATAAAAQDGAASGEPSGAPGGTFGAEGEGSTRDLGRAFTRAIPPACQADPIWGKVRPGPVGSIDLVITIDEGGRIASSESLDRDPPAALEALSKRAVALLGAGTFAIAGGEVGAGRQILRVRATASDVGDAEAGGAAGLSFRYAGRKGEAGFTQLGGRHVEVTVEVLRVEARAVDSGGSRGAGADGGGPRGASTDGGGSRGAGADGGPSRRAGADGVDSTP